MVITSIIQYSSSSLRVETEEAEIFNSKSFFLASRYKTNGELPLLDLLCDGGLIDNCKSDLSQHVIVSVLEEGLIRDGMK